LVERYSITPDPGERAILAVSYGAKDALDAALTPGSPYGCVGLMIPGRRLTPADLLALTERPRSSLRVAILAGQYDGANLATARNADRMLKSAGHDVNFIQVPEGHNRATWRNHFGDVLVSLFGT
jgi:enterochelin esterase-like enzyme